jgi:rod shape-determining protein MreC
MSRINLIALLLLVVVVGWLLTFGAESVAGVREKALTLASPLIRARDAVHRTGENLAQPQLTREQLVAAKDRLERQVQDAAIKEKVLEQLYEENAQLRKALKMQQSSRFKLVAAEVISRETDKWYHTLIIDKGTVQGIAKGDTVMVDRGLVGKISVVGEDIATVLLLTDEACKVTALVAGTDQKGIVEGHGPVPVARGGENALVAQGRVEGLRGGVNYKPLLRLRHLEQRANVQPGMRVESSGAGRVFPAGIEIGAIVSVTPGEIATEAMVEPSVDFRNLSFVFVVTAAKPGPQP